MALVAASENAKGQTESVREEFTEMWCMGRESGQVRSGEQVLERPTIAGDSPVSESRDGLCPDPRLGSLGTGYRI